MAEPHRRDVWVGLGILISSAAAGFSSFAGLQSLAKVSGWGAMSPLFALCLDAYALTAIRVWRVGSTEAHVKRFAKWNAIGAIALSIGSNIAWHLIAAGLMPLTWHVVMAVGAVPPVVLGLVTHLAVLRSQVGRDQPAAAVPPVAPGPKPARPAPLPAAPSPPPAQDEVRTPYPPKPRPPEPASEPPAPPPEQPTAKPPPPTPDGLLEAAREANAAYRLGHDGRPITRDALRQALHISVKRASEVLRQLRVERAAGQ